MWFSDVESSGEGVGDGDGGESVVTWSKKVSRKSERKNNFAFAIG
jgi:hypothetical protein